MVLTFIFWNPYDLLQGIHGCSNQATTCLMPWGGGPVIAIQVTIRLKQLKWRLK